MFKHLDGIGTERGIGATTGVGTSIGASSTGTGAGASAGPNYVTGIGTGTSASTTTASGTGAGTSAGTLPGAEGTTYVDIDIATEFTRHMGVRLREAIIKRLEQVKRYCYSTNTLNPYPSLLPSQSTISAPPPPLPPPPSQPYQPTYSIHPINLST